MISVSMPIVGVDQSINHAGVVILNIHKEVLAAWGFSNKDIDCAKSKHCYRIGGKHVKQPELKESAAMDRTVQWEQEWRTRNVRTIEQFCGPMSNVYCAIEDYAFGQSQGAHQIGEIAGIAKVSMVKNGFYLRTYDPKSVKRFATGSGDATKEEMIAAALKSGFDVERMGLRGDTAGDVADAYWLSRCLITELQIRDNPGLIEKLAQKEKDLFLRVTKSRPVNVLSMPFLGGPR